MQAEKSGRGQYPSTSLRNSQKSTTRLSDSAKLMGTLTQIPDSTEDNVSVAMQLPADGTGESLSVRPATKNAVQVFGSLSRVGKKLRDSQEVKKLRDSQEARKPHDSQEAQTNKRTQSQAGIGEEESEHRRMSKRLRADDSAVRQGEEPDYPASQPDLQAVSQPAVQPAVQPALQPAVQPVQHPTPRPIPQAVTQGVAMRPVPAFGITPDMQAQIAMAEALRMAKSTSPFQPERISELFQHLCRSQLWPLLKLEEQRAMYLMNLQAVLPVHYGVASVPVTGSAMAMEPPSASTMTTTTTTQPGSPTAIPLARTAPTPTNAVPQRAPLSNPKPATQPSAPIALAAHAAQAAQADQAERGRNASRIQENLLPAPPNRPSPDYAQGLLDSLPEGTRLLMKKPAEEIRKMLGWQKLDLATINNMTAFTCLLAEIAAHGGLPQLDGEIDSIVHAFLQRYLTSHRHRESENKSKNKGKGDAESRKVRIGRDPAYPSLLRLLPKYPQFTRVLGIGINNLETTHRTHLGISRRINAVLTLMSERRFLSDADFKRRLEEIVDDASPSESSSTMPTASPPTSLPANWRQGGVDEGSDDEI